LGFGAPQRHQPDLQPGQSIPGFDQAGRQPGRLRDDGLIEGADPTTDNTLINLTAGGTLVELEFAYKLSAQAKLVAQVRPRPARHAGRVHLATGNHQ
jgi:hypothetical protein